ncbi:protein MAIN-LIKE 2-like [Camellia sinensis]|uniref:protein MAIN-LIKE 2-like n=1 Tax=Camellia sinensis TaxID=4442 RepID=UPI001036334C|nr:protein MAIN-LIKE 2-like [Camellia sinensis]
MDSEYQQCVPPTASNRRRRELDVDHERGRGRGRGQGQGRGRDRDPVSVEYDIPSASQSGGRSQRRVEGYDMPDIAVEDTSLPDSPLVQEEYLTHAFPGGPTDPSILRSFNSHVAVAIWHGEERGPLKCHNHSSKILAWPWWLVENNTRFKAIIEQSGLSQLARCTYRFVNKLLISSFVERWQPETNTFHMTVSEMTLTLDDVGTILGLPIVGKSVSIPDVTDHHGVTLLVYGLGITERAAHEEVSSAGGNSVNLEWLRRCTLFSDKSGGKVPVVYLGLLMDLGSIHTYAWGAAALAFLYRQLGFTSRSGVKQIGGYMTLLEAWIYEHFRAFRPHQNMCYNEDMSHVYHWASRREAGSSIDHLKSFRAELDSLRIALALQISHPIIDAGYQEGIRHPYRLYQAIESMTHVLEGQHIDEAGPSSAGPSSVGGRFPSSTLTYSRRPRRRHTADS